MVDFYAFHVGMKNTTLFSHLGLGVLNRCDMFPMAALLKAAEVDFLSGIKARESMTLGVQVDH